jgi:putative restriction endonuclease
VWSGLFYLTGFGFLVCGATLARPLYNSYLFVQDSILDYYIFAFKHLNVNRHRARGNAPHKPVLLLSVVQAYQEGLITDNQIEVTPELIGYFKTNWQALVTTEHTLSFALPFFHLSNEKGLWWRLVPKPGFETSIANASSMSNFNNLTAAVAFVQLDQELAALLSNPTSRHLLRQAILATYFPENPLLGIPEGNQYTDALRRELLEESPAQYEANLQKLKTRLNPETYQIEVYARDAVFRREIVRLYGDTCCITGIQVSAPYAFSMVDACHIVPFYKTFNNHPTNGLALCPNLHRAFDKGAISIDDDYRVVVSSSFAENQASAYRFKALQGTPILLPREKQYQPDRQALAWHRESTFRK